MSIRTFICWYASPPKPPADEVMSRYDVVVGRACPPERRRALRKLNADIRFVVYVNAVDCYLPPDVPDVEFLGVGEVRPEHKGTSHAREVFREHRDFLLLNRRGARERAGNPREIYTWGYQRPYDPTSRYANRFYFDPRSGWKDLYPEVCARHVAAGDYDGVFCDNAGAHIEWNFEKLEDDLKPDVTDAEWARATARMLSNVSRRLKRDRADALTFANTCGEFVRADADDIEPTDFWRDAKIDGAMDEFFAYSVRPDGTGGAHPEPRWREQVRSVLCCEKLGRAYFAQANGPDTDRAGRIYALASFLIGAGDHALFNYNPAPAANYRLVYRFPEWDIDLGRPRVQYESLDEARAAGGGGAYGREFEGGLVLVNPTAEAATVDVPKRARRLVLTGGTITQGGAVAWEEAPSSLTLAAQSAEILLR